VAIIWAASPSPDLGDNPITSKVGRQLLELVRSNPRIVRLSLAGTAIRTGVVEEINAQIRLNTQSRAQVRPGRGPSLPPSFNEGPRPEAITEATDSCR
jgi:hypothetical protein